MGGMGNEVRVQAAIDEQTRGWSPEQKAALLRRLDREATRMLVARRYPTAGSLAQYLAPHMRQTAALRLIDREIEWALATPNARLVISMPPQQGKTQRVGVWSILRALIQDPERRVILASYSETLARSTARESRNWIATSGANATDPITGVPLPDKLGLALASDRAAAGNWQIAGHRGGLYATGVGGSLTGAACDYLVIDDPLKGMAEADSQAEREKIISWWESVAQTRLAPGAPVIIIATRWHEDDLTGHVLKQDRARPAEAREWRVVNIPAIATPGVPDSLGRDPGEPMQSARGTTLTDWHRVRQNVGERVWSALYLGAPTPTEGGLFHQDWFDRNRTDRLPEGVAARLVAVDPAETGKGDEAGIIALAVTPDARAWVTHDHSGKYTSDQWARQAVLLALETNATELSFESYVAGKTYEDVILAAWRRIRHESQILARHATFRDAVAAYEREEVRPDHCAAALDEVSAAKVPDQPDPPFQIRPWRAPGDKAARAAGARQAASTGRLRMIGRFDRLEAQAVTWQAGQKSPDRLDALVQGYERAMTLMGAQAQIATPGDVTPTAGGNFWSSPVG